MQQETAIDPKAFRSAMGRFATGVTVITTRVGDQVHGMTANAFMSVSLEPPLVLISIGHQARMHDYLMEASRYGVSILAEHQQPLSDHFAGRAQPGLSPEFTEALGIPLIGGAMAHVVAEVVARYPAGDHTIFVGRVLHLAQETKTPLVYHGGRYARLEQA